MSSRKKLSLVFIAFVMLLSLTFFFRVFAADTEKTLIESGKTLWRYYVTNTNDFYKMDSEWKYSGYDVSDWKQRATPFGDKENESGWKGDDHGIYLVTTFTLDTLPENSSLQFMMHYDNTAKIYLNGSLLFQDERWNDRVEEFLFPTEFLKQGENILAVSILDDVGGRGFDLTVKLVPKNDGEIAPPDTAPVIPEDAGTPLVISSYTEWQYTVTTTKGFAAMDTNWKNDDFDRSSWKRGAGPFGTNIRPANADRTGWKGDNRGIFLVTTFDIDDLDKALANYYYLDIYYDNTITIYLNSQQVFFRENWNSDYEKIGISLKTALKEGTNTLAVSLLDDAGGREFDMSLYMTEKVVIAGTEVLDSELEEAGLPILRIDTDNGDYVRSRVDYVSANMVFDNMDAYPNEDNIYTEEGGAAIEIRGRGNSTWNNGYPDGKQNTLAGDTHTRKVPYNLKLDEKVNLFGMGKSKKWVLLANYMDRTNLRNKLIYDLSGRMGMTYCQSVYVNLVLNGEYMGVYMLCEKADIDLFEGAVTDFEDYAEDFAKAVAKKYGYDKTWRSEFEDELCENLSWLTEEYYGDYKVSDFVDLSGVSTETGYLIEYDGYADEDSFFTTNHGVPLKISNLESIKSNPTVFNKLKNYINEFEEALYSDTFYNSKGKHYSEYLDMQSFVDYYILNALILNVEFGYKSMYLILNEDGKFVLGPCWDYDWSSGNPFLGANGQYDQWYNDGRANNNKWYRQAYGDPWFVSLVQERWASLDSAIDDMIDSMTFYEEYLLPSSVIEYRKFNADSYETNFKSRTGGRSFSQEVNQLRTFLINRKNWLDSRLSQRDPNIEGFGMDTASSIKLSLSGAGITKGQLFFDYDASATATTVSLSVSYTRSGKAEIYLNGLKVTAVTLSSGFASSTSFALDNMAEGVNAITVYLYDVGGSLLGTNYVTLDLPGEKAVTPTLGSYRPNEDVGTTDPEPDPDTTETSTAPTTEPTPDTTSTPATETEPDEPDEPDTHTLATDGIDVYLQTTAENNGVYDLRVVFVADQAHLFTYEALSVTMVFTASDGSLRHYTGRLSLENGNYTLCHSILADGDTYLAADGDLLFGNCITDIPAGVLASLFLTVQDVNQTTVFEGSRSFT